MNEGRRPTPAPSLLPWTLSFLRPHRGRVVLMVALLLIQIGLSALQPWPLKIVIDYVLDGNPLPEPLGRWSAALVGTRTLAVLVLFVVTGAALEIINQFVTAWHAGTGRHRSGDGVRPALSPLSSTSSRWDCITTLRPAPAMRSTASTSTPMRSRISR